MEPPAQPDHMGVTTEGVPQDKLQALGLRECGGLEQGPLLDPSLSWPPCPASLGSHHGRSEPSHSSPLAHTLFTPFIPQLVSEKVGGAEGTKLDDDFKEMEKVMGEHTCLMPGSVTNPHRARP